MKELTNLLILEDSPYDAIHVQGALEKANLKYDVRVVATRERFIEALNSYPPDLIISDHKLPSFDSFEALEICRKKFPYVPFILVTGSVSEEFAVSIIKAGADDYVLKDYLTRLPTAVQQAMLKRHNQRVLRDAQQELINSEKRFRSLIENSYDMVSLIDVEGRMKYLSPAAERMFGFSIEENHIRNGFDMVHPDDVAMAHSQLRQVLENTSLPVQTIIRIRKKDDTYIWVEGTITNMLETPEIKSVVVNFRDITERKHNEEKVTHANRLYSFISQINQTIVHSSDEQTLFKAVCRIAIELGEFKMAWIGLFDPSQTKISLVEECGCMPEDRSLFINIPFAKKGPQNHIMLTGNHFICNDIEKDLGLADWSDWATRRSIGSTMVLPIKKSGRLIGSFNLYATEKDFFDKAEAALLTEATEDISFALSHFERDKISKQAKEDIARSNLRMKEAQQIAHLGSWETNFESGISTWSDEACRIYGLAATENIQTYESWVSFLHPDDAAQVIRQTTLSGQTLNDSIISYRIVLRDGTVKHLYSESKFEIDQQGKATRMAGIMLDVSHLKLAEQNEEFDRNNIKSLINNTNDLMWSVDRDYHLITSNIAFEKVVQNLSGHPVTKGSNVLETAFTEDQLKRFVGYYKRAFSGETFTAIEYTGSPVEYWSEISYYPILNGKEVIGTACFARDITERKKAESATKAERILLRTLIDNLPSNIYTKDLNSRKTLSNRVDYEFMGVKSEAEVLGKDDFDFFSKESATNTSYEEKQLFKTGIAIIDEEEWQPINGRNTWFLKSKIPLRNDDNEIIGLIGISHDITARKLAEERINEQNKKLKEIAWTQSHSVRAPLARIMGLVNILKNYPSEKEDTDEIMNLLVKSAEDLDRILGTIVRKTEELRIESPASPPAI